MGHNIFLVDCLMTPILQAAEVNPVGCAKSHRKHFVFGGFCILDVCCKDGISHFRVEHGAQSFDFSRLQIRAVTREKNRYHDLERCPVVVKGSSFLVVGHQSRKQIADTVSHQSGTENHDYQLRGAEGVDDQENTQHNGDQGGEKKRDERRFF